jgi:hypothetical protein
MPKRLFFFLLLSAAVLGSSAAVYAQSPLDSYKYIIVPKRFDFLRKENQYRVNSQTKYLFEKNGFTTLLKGQDYPDDLLANPCLGVEANVIDESNSFTSKVRVSLTNCQDQVVYTSEQGKSKEKDYAKSYSLALENAFKSIAQLSYQFNPDLAIVPAFASAQTEAAEMEVAQPEPVSEPAPEVAVAAAALPAATAETAKKETGMSGAVTYGNENIAFFLIDQGDKLAAYVVRSASENYEEGEKIGTFEKSSLPNVYRVEWKDMDKDIEQTTGYFDEQGNLKIDVKRDGKVEVLTFAKE